MTTEFTREQLDNWQEYESVREDGAFNMLDPRARQASGLTKEEYAFVHEHYSELREAVESTPLEKR